MSQVEIVSTEKTCFNHIHDSIIYFAQLDTTVSIVAILSLNSTFWLRLKLQVRAKVLRLGY